MRYVECRQSTITCPVPCSHVVSRIFSAQSYLSSPFLSRAFHTSFSGHHFIHTQLAHTSTLPVPSQPQAKLRADLTAAQTKASAAADDIDQLTADFQKLARENQTLRAKAAAASSSSSVSDSSSSASASVSSASALNASKVLELLNSATAKRDASVSSAATGSASATGTGSGAVTGAPSAAAAAELTSAQNELDALRRVVNTLRQQVCASCVLVFDCKRNSAVFEGWFSYCCLPFVCVFVCTLMLVIFGFDM